MLLFLVLLPLLPLLPLLGGVVRGDGVLLGGAVWLLLSLAEVEISRVCICRICLLIEAFMLVAVQNTNVVMVLLIMSVLCVEVLVHVRHLIVDGRHRFVNRHLSRVVLWYC